MATTENWKDKNTGEKRELTEWHRLVFRRKLAEIAGQYLKKGASVYIEGRIRTRKWTDKEGQERYTTEIDVGEMQMLGRREGQGAPAGSEPAGASDYQPGPAKKAGNATKPSFDDLDDDIPF